MPSQEPSDKEVYDLQTRFKSCVENRLPRWQQILTIGRHNDWLLSATRFKADLEKYSMMGVFMDFHTTFPGIICFSFPNERNYCFILKEHKLPYLVHR